MAASDLLPFAELWPTVASAVEPLPIEILAVGDARRRVLRENAVAGWDLPMADNSAMDGYAVRSVDTAAAPDCELRVLEADAYAGSDDEAVVEPGTAVAIGTGGLIPAGADAVVIKEIVDRIGGHITVREPVATGAHIRRAGEELRAGDVVITAGEVLTPVRIAAAAAAGVQRVTVGRRPRVAVLSTGSELVAMGEAARPGQVVNTNAPLLAMTIEDLLGRAPETPEHVIDDPGALAERLRSIADSNDVLVVSGGVSVGDRDLVKQTVERDLGFKRLVWRVAQKPGKPTYVARRGGRWVVGLPGNPAAVAVGWYLLLRPLLLALMGASEPMPRRFPVRLSEAVQPNSLRTDLRWSVGQWRGPELWAAPLGRSGSHMLSDLARSDLLVVIPPGEDELAPGSEVEAIQIGPI